MYLAFHDFPRCSIAKRKKRLSAAELLGAATAAQFAVLDAGRDGLAEDELLALPSSARGN